MIKLLKTIIANPLAILIILAAVKLLIPLFAHPDFEFHRDEFLYMAMGDHLARGYLEVPPFIALVARFAKFLLGESLYAMRFFPALAGALTLLLTGLMSREFGGGRFSQILAAVAFLLSLIYLRINLFLMPVSFDLFFFVLAVYLFIRTLNSSRPVLWILIGIVAGVGLLNKYTMLLFGFGMGIGLLLTPQRKTLKDKWPYIAAGIAFLIWSPNLLWQFQNDWPFFEHMRILAETQLSHVDPVGFLLVQLLMNLYSSPVWIAGLIALFFSQKLKRYRPIGWMYLSLLAVMLLLNGKVYYLAPAYPMLLAAGAVVIEAFVQRMNQQWIKPVILTILISGSLILLPIGIPVFSVPGMIKYFEFSSRYLGTGEALRWETGKLHELPQDYADMLGWEEMVNTIAKTYHRLPDSLRSDCAIFAANYGEAGAIDYYGKNFNLPRCISKAGSFWSWGYRDYNGEQVIIVGFDREDVLYFYEDVKPGEPFQYPHARESGSPIFISHQPRMSLTEIWQILKKYRY